MENRATAELINIIRTIYISKDDKQEVDLQIKRLETEFVDCDARIDMYIRNYSKDLTRLIKVFNDIWKKIEQSRTNVTQSRESLKQCKILLQSKRDDVRRLLLEYWEQKTFSENIEKLKNLYLAPDNIRLLCSNKQYFEATKQIAECTKLLENDYREIIGLHDVKRQIEEECIKLEKFLYQEISEQFYISVRKSILESNQSGMIGLTRAQAFERRYLHNFSSTDVKHDDDIGSQNNDTEDFIGTIVKSALNLTNLELNMNILEKMINDIHKNINTELINMIQSTSQHVLESNLIDNTTKFYNRNLKNTKYIENNPKLLCQLIELVFEQFKLTARYYRAFIMCASKESQVKYQSSLIWLYIQNTLIQLLEEYLDVKQANLITETDRITDINAFFTRKSLLTLPFGTSNANTAPNTDLSTNRKIFTFKGSSHSIKINQYNKEKNNENLFKTNVDEFENDDFNENEQNKQRLFKILVCEPSHRNITTIYSTMAHILKEISDEIRNIPQNDSTVLKPELTLEKFLHDFILNTFITNAVQSITKNANIQQDITNDGHKYEIPKQLISLDKQRELNLNRPILQNTWLVYECCYDLYNLMIDMSPYANEFAKAMCYLIEEHIEHCNKLFFSIVKQHQSIQDYVYSMVWVMDDSINKYFKQLPSYSSAMKGKSATIIMTQLSSTTVNSAAIAATNEVKQINYDLLNKEVDTLISNLNDKELEEMDIIVNYHYIEMIAHLHESFDWLIIQLKSILGSIEQMIKNPKSLNYTLSTAEQNKLKAQLENLEKWRGDTLLLLYLETRVHCFYHLNNFIKQENNTAYAGDVDTDPDDVVLNMNRDLHRIHEHLSRSLQESKVNYVFDALGFMIASIFIKAIKNFKKVSTHGIAKMCRNIFHVEQNLSAIRTKSDPHLMKAHRFYELLHKKPEELLNHLQEHEAEFQINDYTNLLNLIYRSQPGNEIRSLSDNITLLQNILRRKH